jgi:adenylate cyclase
MEAISHFKEGIAHYRAGNWDKGIKSFRESQALNPDDRLLDTYIARCEYLKASPPEGEWNGVWVMTSK